MAASSGEFGEAFVGRGGYRPGIWVKQTMTVGTGLHAINDVARVADVEAST